MSYTVQHSCTNFVDSLLLELFCHSLSMYSETFALLFYIQSAEYKKQPCNKTYVSRERYNLNYSNSQCLLLRDIARDSENFIHIFNWKQKLQLSKLKSAILQLNTCYYRNCYMKNANKIKLYGIRLKGCMSYNFIGPYST